VATSGKLFLESYVFQAVIVNSFHCINSLGILPPWNKAGKAARPVASWR
jgi:hypothetical protein